MENRMVCKKCGKEVKAGAKFCDKCGAPIQQKEKRTTPKIDKRFLYIIASVLGICAVVILMVGVLRLWKYLFPSADRRLIGKEYYDTMTKECIGRDEYDYDEAGNPIKKTYYQTYLRGEMINHYEYYAYNSEGELIIKELYHIMMDGDGDAHKYEYEYDEAGNVIKEIDNYYSGGKDEVFRVTESEFKYDSEGKVLIKNGITYYTNYPDKQFPYYEYAYDDEYDSEDNLIKRTYYCNRTKVNRTDYKYDSDNKLVEEIISYDELTYDSRVIISDRNILEYFGYSSIEKDSFYNRVEKKYDEAGNLVTYTLYEDDNIRQMKEYIYDRANNLIKEQWYIPDASDESKTLQMYRLVKYIYE